MLKEIVIAKSLDGASIEFLKTRTQGRKVLIVGPGGSSKWCADVENGKAVTKRISDALNIPAIPPEEAMGELSWRGKYHIPFWEFLSSNEVYEYFDTVIAGIPSSHAGLIHKGCDHFTRGVLWADSTMDWQIFPEYGSTSLSVLNLSILPTIPKPFFVEETLVVISAQKGKRLRILKRKVLV